MAIWLLPSEESKTRRKGHTNALVPGKWNCRQWYVSGGRHERKAVLPKVAPILFTIYLWWQLFLIEQDESVVCGAEPQLFLQVPSNAVEAANHAVLLYKQREELLIQAVGIRSVCSRCHLTDRWEAVLITGRRGHKFERDTSIPVWHGWHATRRGLGSNLYRLGVPDMVIQRILRHANVSTTATYYIKTATDDVRNAMVKLENRIEEAARAQQDTVRTLDAEPSDKPATIQ